jgi:hypothetical protein
MVIEHHHHLRRFITRTAIHVFFAIVSGKVGDGWPFRPELDAEWYVPACI